MAAPENKSKPVRARKDRRTMNASEAIFSLFGFLTTRKNPIIFGAAYDCAPIAEILREFINFHKLAPARDGMITGTCVPNTEHFTNDPKLQKQAVKMYDAADVLADLHAAMSKAPAGESNKIIARFLQKRKEELQARVQYMASVSQEVSDREDKASTELMELNHILIGNYSIF